MSLPRSSQHSPHRTAAGALKRAADQTAGGLVGKGLAQDRLGLASSTVIGLSSTAPLYSLAATVGLVVAAAGLQAPAALIAAFIPMLLTAFAYRELNSAVPDAGTAFTWAAKAFGPRTGWLSGWGVAVAGVIVMANQTEVASRSFWALLGGEDLAGQRWLVTLTGVVLILAMTWVSLRNVETGAAAQWVLIAVQYCAMTALLVGILLPVLRGERTPAQPFVWEMLNPWASGSSRGFLRAVLVAIFIYWGWDTCLAMSEETRNPQKTPGQAAVLSSVLLVLTYVLVTTVAMMYAGAGTTGTGLGNPDNADDIFRGIQSEVLGPFGWFVTFAVGVSALATCQTTILPTARGTFAMAVYKALPRRFADTHPRFHTPGFSTVFMGVVSAAFFAGMSLISENMLADTVEATSVAVAAYYTVTSFACVAFFRGEQLSSARNLLFRLILPLAGGLLMLAVLAASVLSMADPDYGSTRFLGVSGVFATAAVSLGLGVLLMAITQRVPGTRDFFEGRSLHRGTEVLVRD